MKLKALSIARYFWNTCNKILKYSQKFPQIHRSTEKKNQRNPVPQRIQIPFPLFKNGVAKKIFPHYESTWYNIPTCHTYISKRILIEKSPLSKSGENFVENFRRSNYDKSGFSMAATCSPTCPPPLAFLPQLLSYFKIFSRPRNSEKTWKTLRVSASEARNNITLLV